MASRDMLPQHPAELTLLDYLVGDLAPDVSDQIRRHVQECRACRRTIAELSLTVDELDRLPTVAIPHDALGLHAKGGRRPAGGHLRRVAPVALMLAAAASVVGLLRLSTGEAPTSPTTQHLVLHVPAEHAAAPSETQEWLRGLLGGIPARVIRDADDEGHLVVEVENRAVGAALDRLRPATALDGGEDLTVDVVGIGSSVPSP